MFPEAPDMSPRVRAINALLCLPGQAGSVGECHSSELVIVPHEVLCSFVHLSVFSDGLSAGVFWGRSQRSGLGPDESPPKILGCTFAFTVAGYLTY